MANNPTLDQLLRGLYQTESSGRFNALGPVTKNGDRAYGISQVMGNNVGPWTQQYFGQRLSPDEYLNNKDAQVAVTKGKMGELLNKYGNPQDAISTWFSGRPLRQAGNASDGFLQTPEYVNKVLNAAQGYDPKSMVAMAPEGADGQPTAPPTAQSISLGSEEQQPLSNIGSTLANMGASIASLDNRGTGIASLNASRVASNLQQQEALRERENGWKYAGQTQNGQGLMFQNSKGELRVEPLAPGFAGQKESSTTQMLREINEHPELKQTYKDLHGSDDVTLSQEAISSAAKRIIGGEKGVLTRMSKGNAARIAEEVYAQTGDDPGQILENQIASTGKSAEARTIGTSVGKSAVSAGTFESGAMNTLEASKKVGRGQFVPINQIDQLLKKNASDPDVLDFQAAHQTFIREYAKAINPNGNPTVSDMNHARELLSTATDEQAYERVVQRLQKEVAQKQANLEKLNGGKKTIRDTSGSTGLPGVGQKTTINGVEIERLD